VAEAVRPEEAPVARLLMTPGLDKEQVSHDRCMHIKCWACWRLPSKRRIMRGVAPFAQTRECALLQVTVVYKVRRGISKAALF
jgi:hypothetical protein